jgi:hypothetical protein
MVPVFYSQKKDQTKIQFKSIYQAQTEITSLGISLSDKEARLLFIMTREKSVSRLQVVKFKFFIMLIPSIYGIISIQNLRPSKSQMLKLILDMHKDALRSQMGNKIKMLATSKRSIINFIHFQS